MKKKFLLFLVVVMLVGALGVMPGFAEEIKESTSGFSYVEANGDQIAVSVADQDLLIQVDGLYFRDLNKNGTLDPAVFDQRVPRYHLPQQHLGTSQRPV